MSATLFVEAPAKLNLVLRVVGRRPDGYHLLETLLHPLQLGDGLWLQQQPAGIELTLRAELPRAEVPAGADNLVVRALQRLAAAAGYDGGFAAHLHKRVPAGAGLGGGSSDAAAALRLGNALLGGMLPAAALHELARGLGADVPFFLAGGSQWGRGIGDELEPASVPPRHFLLLLPPFGCPTKDVYKTHAAELNAGGQQASIRPASGSLNRDFEVRGGFVNDLEPAAERLRPELAALRRRLEGKGFAAVRMAGSGSTLFLAFDDADGLAAARHRLADLERDGIGLLATASGPERLPAPVPAAWPGGG